MAGDHAQARPARTEALGIARVLYVSIVVTLTGVAGLAPIAPGTSPDGAAAATTSSAPYPDKPFVAARSAREFGDSVGVNVRLTWLDSAYGDFDTLLARMGELGVRHVRDGLCAECPYNIDRLNRLGAAGIKAHIIAGRLQGGAAEMHQNLTAIRNRVRGAVVSVGAPNEPDYSGEPLWLEKTRTYQRDLWQTVKGDPALRELQVLGPAVVLRPNRIAVGDISPYLDRGNIHPYPGGNTPLYNIEDEKNLAAYMARGKALVATEAGYHSDMGEPGNHPPTSERASGYYMPRLALEGFRSGLERTYIHQLADPWSPAVAKTRGLSVMENTFGLLRWDLSPKPAFLALRNLLRATDGSSQPVAAPGGLRYGLENAGPDVRQLLLRSADGSYSLVLWREVSVWDRHARVDVFPAADQLDVVLGQPMSLARRFDPVVSNAERGRWANPLRIPVDVGGGPVVLRFTPPCVITPGGGSGSGSSSGSGGTGSTPAGTTPLGTPLSPPESASSPGPPAPAKTAPRASRAPVRLRLSGTRARPRLGKSISIKVSCAAPCAVIGATAKLALKRGQRKRRFRLKATKGRPRNGVATLRLRIPARARRAARQALRRGGRVSAYVRVTARTAAGSKVEVTGRKVLFRRR